MPERHGYIYDEECENKTLYVPTAILEKIEELATENRKRFNFMAVEVLKRGLGMPSKFGLGEKQDE